MPKPFKLAPTSQGWAIMARQRPGKRKDSRWLPLGTCHSKTIAQRVYLALLDAGRR